MRYRRSIRSIENGMTALRVDYHAPVTKCQGPILESSDNNDPFPSFLNGIAQ